ncbi:TetR family transcriptional regulator [Modestobacter sp. I12A-02628]|uniref:TetR/AcrR family transcriptional regulator n=1 Tax=Goekera deserti TaxID=2497753 RepID=A0A7K3WEH8_9ACTN|nr:TetR/AcrR family transcriptional regulator [Goekera deserti]MPQ96945.1 TetR family transcriptional regulator [Goekera deserti]NDI46740.1 TetR family transcriptional regulator [Goekera deserti]NEL54309.1 TetR/AcrR family transcriptional regulator [Goekera deserti]
MVGRKQFDPDVALDAATRLFWERSYSAASITDLVAATGLSRGSLYATFGDKQALFLACLQRYVERVGEASRTAVAVPSDDVRVQVMAGFDAVLDRMADPTRPAGCLLAQTAAESSALDPRVQAAVQRILDDEVEQMSRVLQPHAHRADVDVRSLARFLVGTAQALAVLHRAGTPVGELRETAAHALRALDVLRP